MKRAISPISVYISTPNADTAQLIAEKLIENRVAACVNIFPQIVSVYEWEGKIRSEPESVLIVKSEMRCYANIEQVVLAHHPYECPCIVALPIQDGNAKYLKWISGQLGASTLKAPSPRKVRTEPVKLPRKAKT